MGRAVQAPLSKPLPNGIIKHINSSGATSSSGARRVRERAHERERARERESVFVCVCVRARRARTRTYTIMQDASLRIIIMRLVGFRYDEYCTHTTSHCKKSNAGARRSPPSSIASKEAHIRGAMQGSHSRAVSSGPVCSFLRPKPLPFFALNP
jgi:hypothetical protein